MQTPAYPARQICSDSRRRNGLRCRESDNSDLSIEKSWRAVVVCGISRAFIEFARSADNRYGSSRSSSSRGKLWVTRLSAGMGACGSATRTPLVGYTHRPRRKLTESKLRARWLQSTRRYLTCGISPSDQPKRFKQSFYSGGAEHGPPPGSSPDSTDVGTALGDPAYGVE